jgi:hypothetical protein
MLVESLIKKKIGFRSTTKSSKFIFFEYIEIILHIQR